ncbi:MAG: lysylphosphatidylglycerol synthase domain-containing protein [Gemmatimonadota bacterium]
MARGGGEGLRERAGRLRWLIAVFGLAALGSAGYLAYRRWEEFGELRESVAEFPWRFDLPWAVAAILLAVTSLTLTAAIWTRTYRKAGGELGYRQGAAAWFVSNLGRYIPGKVWQVSSLAVYAKARGQSGASAVSTSILVQVVTLLTGVAIGLGLAGPEAAGPLVGSPLRAALLAASLGVFLHPRIIRAATAFLSRRLREAEVERTLGGRDIVWTGAALVVVWMGYGMAYWCLLRAMMGSLAPEPLLAVGIFAASYVAGFVVLVAPGGLVVREGAMGALLVALGGISAPVAAAVAVAARVWITGAELAAAGLSVAAAGGLRLSRVRDPEDRGSA